MLDNMTPEEMKQAIEIIDGRAETECSGNVTKEKHQPCDCSWRRLYFQRSTDTFSSYIGHFLEESTCYRIKNDSLRAIFFMLKRLAH